MNNIGLLAVYVIGFIAIFYFLAIRPQQRQRKAHETLVSSVKRGDKVVSIGGIHGTVKRVDDTSIMLEVAKGVEVKLSRRAIAEISRPETKAEKSAPEISSPSEPFVSADTPEVSSEQSEKDEQDTK